MFYARKGLDLLMDIISKTGIIFLNRYEMEILTGDYYREGAEKKISLFYLHCLFFAPFINHYL